MTPAGMSEPGPADDTEDMEPGLARERTSLAWTRTAISFAALGGALLKTAPTAGVVVLGMSALIWGLGRMPGRPGRPGPPGRHGQLLITLAVTAMSLIALTVTLLSGGGRLPFR
jgi:uncharacterized membrane protein YidH (DUF202 family)